MPPAFDLDRIYEYPDLDSLQVVDVRSAPSSISAAARHFIAFKSPSNVAPVWCSEAHLGRGQLGSEWIRDETLRPRRRTGPEVVELIGKARYAFSEELDPSLRRHDARFWLPQSFTVLSFSV